MPFFPEIFVCGDDTKENDSPNRKNNKNDEDGRQDIAAPISKFGEIIIYLQQKITTPFGNGWHEVIFFLSKQIGDCGKRISPRFKIMNDLWQCGDGGCPTFSARIMQQNNVAA